MGQPAGDPGGSKPRPPGWLRRLEQPHDGSRLPGWQLALFAAPDVGTRAAYFPLTLYVPAMYSEELGVGLATLGFVFAAIRFVDMAWDPAVAILLDRTHTRFGRRRPWMIASTPVLLLAIVLLYLPGAVAGEQATWRYLLVALAVLYFGQTFFGLSHDAWGAELSTDYRERSRVQAYVEWVGTAGGMALLGIPIFVEVFVEAEAMSPRVAAMAWFALLVIPATVALNVLFVPERHVGATERTRFWQAIRLLFTNRHLVRLAMIDMLFWIQSGVASALMVFWVKYWVQAPRATTTVVLLSQLGTLAAVPLWTRLSLRLGKHRTVAVAYGAFLFVHALYPLIGPGDIVLFWALVALAGSSAYSARFLLRSITVDIVDYDHWKSGEERTALFFAVLSTTRRIGPSIAIAVVYPLLAFLGFDPAASEPDAAARQALRWVYIIVPMLVVGFAAYLLYHFELDEAQQRELRRRIEARDRRTGRDDPGPGEKAPTDR